MPLWKLNETQIPNQHRKSEDNIRTTNAHKALHLHTPE
jgi:hypothetical protein